MTVKLVVKRCGPIAVEGDVELTDHEGKPIDLGTRTRILLCRCGESAYKPFCDGAHNRVAERLLGKSVDEDA